MATEFFLACVHQAENIRRRMTPGSFARPQGELHLITWDASNGSGILCQVPGCGELVPPPGSSLSPNRDSESECPRCGDLYVFVRSEPAV